MKLFIGLCLAVFAAVVLTNGCATQRTAVKADFASMVEPWVGVLTYDEALLRAGEPDALFYGDLVYVAYWRLADAHLRLAFDKRTNLLVGWHAWER